MDAAEIIRQGGFVSFSVVMYLLWRDERAERKKYQEKYEGSLEDRRLDAKETTDKVTNVLPNISQGIKLLTDKIVLGKKEGQ